MKIILFNILVEVEISKVDLPLIQNNSWQMNDNGYIRGISGKYKGKYLHKIIAERMGLDLSNEIDHKDLNRLNNQRLNLRPAIHAQNQMNSKIQLNNTSGFKGVYRHKQRWRAVIRVNRKSIHLGYFDTPQQAHEAYCEAATKYHGKFARFG